MDSRSGPRRLRLPVAWCFYRVLNPDASNNRGTHSRPNADFFGGYYLPPTVGLGADAPPARRLDAAHGGPVAAHCHATILYRAPPACTAVQPRGQVGCLL